MEPYELRRGRYKNLTLRLVPPAGAVRVSAPWYLPRPVIDRFVAERADWIAQKRRSFAVFQPEPGAVWVWGIPHRLRVESPGRLPRVILDSPGSEVVLRVPAAWTAQQRQKVLDRWEGDRVAEALAVLVPAWLEKTGLRVEGWRVKRLRSRWGSCRPDTGTLVFNARLGAFPPVCLEHVVAHEMAHLVHAHHNAAFHALVESWLPGAAQARQLLRSGPGGPAGGAAGAAVPESPATPGEGTPTSAPRR